MTKAKRPEHALTGIYKMAINDDWNDGYKFGLASACDQYEEWLKEALPSVEDVNEYLGGEYFPSLFLDIAEGRKTGIDVEHLSQAIHNLLKERLLKAEDKND